MEQSGLDGLCDALGVAQRVVAQGGIVADGNFGLHGVNAGNALPRIGTDQIVAGKKNDRHTVSTQTIAHQIMLGGDLSVDEKLHHGTIGVAVADNALGAFAPMVADEQRGVAAQLGALGHAQRTKRSGDQVDPGIQLLDEQIGAVVVSVVDDNLLCSGLKSALGSRIDIVCHHTAGEFIFPVVGHDLTELIDSGDAFRIHGNVDFHGFHNSFL